MPTAEPYSAAVLAVTGEPNCTGAIAEGVDARAREKATSEQWHPFHVASVSLSHMKSHLVLLNSHIRSTSQPGRFWLTLSSSMSVSARKWRIPLKAGRHSSTIVSSII
jgi:hypothetical protein